MIFCTSESSYALESFDVNPINYLLKPVDREELSGILKKLELSFTDISDPHALVSEEDKDLSPEEIVTLVKDYVKKNYRQDIDLNTIAQNLGFSSSYLTKVFNRVENTTPSKYIRTYRMGVAKRLLADGVPVGQVATLVGYNDPFHFSKSFKQTFGISPTAFREKGQGSVL